jgi:pilus assembly protein Flp/PilA
MQTISRFVHDEDGATAIEYGLIAGLVALGAITAFTVFGTSLLGLFGYVRDEVVPVLNSAG